VLGNTDERRKRSVVQRVRERVTRIEADVLSCGLVHLQRAAVINRVPGKIVATDQTRRIARNSTVVVLAGRIARRRRPGRRARVRPARNALNGTKIPQCRAQQVMCCDKKVTGADGESSADLSIDLQAGLFRVWNRTVPIRVAVPDRSRSSRSADN